MTAFDLETYVRSLIELLNSQDKVKKADVSIRAEGILQAIELLAQSIRDLPRPLVTGLEEAIWNVCKHYNQIGDGKITNRFAVRAILALGLASTAA